MDDLSEEFMGHTGGIDGISLSILEGLEPVRKMILSANFSEMAECLETSREEYLKAENRLHEFLAFQCKTSIENLKRDNEYPLSGYALSLYEEIIAGYSRVSERMG